VRLQSPDMGLQGDDFWWNLELVASRRELGDVRSVLDVGAGVGHWGTLLASVLSPDASIVGIEREPQWVQETARRAMTETRAVANAVAADTYHSAGGSIRYLMAGRRPN